MKGNNDECLVVLPFEIGISILFNKFEFDICTIINDSMVIAIIKQKDLLNIKWKDFYIEIDRILGA